MVLQLNPWRPNIQPILEKLETDAVWVQLYHLPMEAWHGEMFETIGDFLGELLKVDESTENRMRARFAHIYVETSLSL